MLRQRLSPPKLHEPKIWIPLFVQSEVSQIATDKHPMLSRMWLKKSMQRNVFAEQKQTQRLRKHVQWPKGTHWLGWTEGVELAYAHWGLWWLVHRDLLSHTENPTQYSVIMCMGKGSEKEWMCGHGSRNPLVVQLQWSPPCKSTSLPSNFKKEKRKIFTHPYVSERSTSVIYVCTPKLSLKISLHWMAFRCL